MVMFSCVPRRKTFLVSGFCRCFNVPGAIRTTAAVKFTFG